MASDENEKAAYITLVLKERIAMRFTRHVQMKKLAEVLNRKLPEL